MKKCILALCTISLALCMAACGKVNNDMSDTSSSNTPADKTTSTSVSETV